HFGHAAQDIELLARGWTDVRKNATAMARGGQIHQLTGVGRDGLHGQTDVLHAGLHVAEHVAHGIRAIALDDVHRVHAVALGLAHAFAFTIQDVGVNKDIGKWYIPHVVQTHEHHTHHPQGDDVAARYQARARIVVLQTVRIAILVSKG